MVWNGRMRQAQRHGDAEGAGCEFDGLGDGTVQRLVLCVVGRWKWMEPTELNDVGTQPRSGRASRFEGEGCSHIRAFAPDRVSIKP
jgi:hypothetical protein